MTFGTLTSTSRREFLARNALGIGSVALAWLMNQEQLLGMPANVPKKAPTYDLKPKVPKAEPQAKAMISLFMHGGPPHMDLTDPKPLLTKFSGTDYSGEVTYSFINAASKKLLGSPFRFRKHGECGTELSEMLPHTAKIVDDICVVRSMHTDINGHEPSIWFMNTGRAQPGRPALGSWLTYGLGSMSQNLPAYIAMPDPGGHPVDGVRNWSNGWMPPLFQATVIRAQEPRILNLDPPPHLKGDLQRQNLDFLARLNRRHLERHPGEADLEARIASYELAAHMQSAAKEALDVSQETLATQNMYGLDRPETREYGTRLADRPPPGRARRAVRADLHRRPDLGPARQPSRRAGRLLREDRQAGRRPRHRPQAARPAWTRTLVHWGGEIGRLPVTQAGGATAATTTARASASGWPAAASKAA